LVIWSCNNSNWLYYFGFWIENFWDIAFQFVSFRLDVFYCEWNHCSSNLYSHSMVSFKSKFIFKHNNSSKFRCIILNIKSILLALNNSMASAYTDVINSNLTFMSSSKFEFRLDGSYCK
jgi:hypothetical protein